MLLKKQFEHVGGLQNTLLQCKCPLQLQDVGKTILQVIHVRSSHWAALKVSGSMISLHGSPYTTITFEVIAQLVRYKDTAITINIMNIAKQAGSSDCALFALVNVRNFPTVTISTLA